MSRLRILSLDVDIITYQNALEQIINYARNRNKGYACFANVHMTVEAHQSSVIADSVNAATFVFADGYPLVTSLQLLYGKKQERIAGMDFMPSILDACEKNGLSVFFYGGSEMILDEIQKKVKLSHPGLKISGAISPPFRVLSQQELKSDIDDINNSDAHIVLVSLGCPKQELWMSDNHSKLKSVLLGVGGAFPVYAGLKRRAPLWMQKCSLEWFYRFIQEPKRMWKRYLITNSVFLYSIFIQLIHTSFKERPKNELG